MPREQSKRQPGPSQPHLPPSTHQYWGGTEGPSESGTVVMIQELFQQLCFIALWLPSSILLINVVARDPWELSCPAACWEDLAPGFAPSPLISV